MRIHADCAPLSGGRLRSMNTQVSIDIEEADKVLAGRRFREE